MKDILPEGVLSTSFKHDGHKGWLVANDDGLFIGKKKFVKTPDRKFIVTWEPIHCIVRWDDVTGYDIDGQRQNMFAGSDISTPASMFTFKTATTQETLKIKWDNPAKLRSQLGPILARIDASNQVAMTEAPPPAAGPEAPDPAEQLKKLSELREAGLLTEEEFQDKRTEIIKRL
jgi:hypothetical protein